jgi:hypothetical protein
LRQVLTREYSEECDLFWLAWKQVYFTNKYSSKKSFSIFFLNNSLFSFMSSWHQKHIIIELFFLFGATQLIVTNIVHFKDSWDK